MSNSPKIVLESALSMSNNWRHNAVGLEDEKQREDHFEPR
jgi:hypothetical protein